MGNQTDAVIDAVLSQIDGGLLHPGDLIDEEFAFNAPAGSGSLDLLVTDLAAGDTTHFDVTGPAFDPRPSPDGDHVAYVCGPELRVTDRSGEDRSIAGDPGEPDTVSWGSADFIAASASRRKLATE